jgi:glycerate 2-kinase
MALVDAALAAVEPGAALRRTAQLEGDSLLAGGRRHDLGRGRVVVLGAGKAAVPMARALEALLGARIHRGLVIAKRGQVTGALPRRIQVLEAAHPVPAADSLAAAEALVRTLSPPDAPPLTKDDLVICLISGGGSALMTLPAPGVELEQLEALNALLLAGGVPINGVNAVRKHLSRIKGAQLARLAAPARVLSLILSDVVGSPLDVIASGPTAPDPTTFADALGVLDRHGLRSRTPISIVKHLEAAAQETPKPGDLLFERVDNVIIGSNEVAAEAVAIKAEALGCNTAILSTCVEGEAREVGGVLAAVLREMAERQRPLPRPACLVVGGETTVTLGDRPGAGGRNQELALAAALSLQGLQDVALVALATDGNDGPTNAGGAVVDGGTVARGVAAGFDAAAHLDRHDAYPFFAALDDLLLIGPTGTNVNDLTLLLTY